MRIKMLSLQCGPEGNFNVGDEREVVDIVGSQLIAGGYAIDITPRIVEQAVIIPDESAVVGPVEAAVASPVEKRRSRQSK